MSSGPGIREVAGEQARLESLCVNTLRMLAVDMVQSANSGHPGAPMGAAPMAFALWDRHLKHSPANPAWPDRDRFVLSAGHASALLYGLLHLTGYDVGLEQLKLFRQLGSSTPGHPERGPTPGVEATTGPLGTGFAAAVGIAMAERHLAERFNRPGYEIVDHFTFGICSDGDLMEGVASEAASLAGTLGLGKLIFLYDDNEITIEGSTDLTFREHVGDRFRAYGWQVLDVDGSDVDEVSEALATAKEDHDRPTLIVAHTVIATGSPNKAGTSASHGMPLGEEEVALTKKALGWPASPNFYIPGEAFEHFRAASSRGTEVEREWEDRLEAYRHAYPEEAAGWDRMTSGSIPDSLDAELPWFPADHGPVATRVASGRALNVIVRHVDGLLGGSADLAPSNETTLKGYGSFGVDGWSGRNIHFGVREFAMGCIANGLALHGGLVPYTATFLIFSDYMKPAIRLAALQRLRVIYLFTHDSIGVGEDGPTHQPIEQTMALRAIPGLTVIRPADANETLASWREALGRPGPTALVLTRQAVPVIGDVAKVRAGVPRGGYTLSDSASRDPDVLLVATGSEVALALQAQTILAGEDIAARVVSLPSWELFSEQDAGYRDSVLPPQVRPRVAIEAGVSLGWERVTGDFGELVTIDTFGASGPANAVFKKFGFTPESVVDAAKRSLSRYRASEGRADRATGL